MADDIDALGRQLAEAFGKRTGSDVSMSFGTVAAVHEYTADVKLDVSVYGGTLYGLSMTTACQGVAAGDRVVVMTYGHISVVTGVVAHEATAANKVLWSHATGWYMIASHTATLSENVSVQKTGIVLHWQAYSDGSAQNWDHNYVFVPKQHVVASAGGGVAMTLVNSAGDHMCRKYVYVSDNRVTGNDYNSQDQFTGSPSGVTWEPRYFVLTQILGV